MPITAKYTERTVTLVSSKYKHKQSDNYHNYSYTNFLRLKFPFSETIYFETAPKDTEYITVAKSCIIGFLFTTIEKPCLNRLKHF